MTHSSVFFGTRPNRLNPDAGVARHGPKPRVPSIAGVAHREAEVA
jgi:hypothetical protein